MSVKLESSDKKIVLVDQNVIKKMVTIQTMLENLGGGDDTDNDEPIPIYAVNGEILNKVINWAKYHIEKTNKTDRGDLFFITNLEEIFQLQEAADYLEVNSLFYNIQVFIDKQFEMITTTEAIKNLSPEKFRLLLTRDSLNVSSEQTVFKSLEIWNSEDPEERAKYLPYLIRYIRAYFLSSQSIDDVKNFLVKNSHHDLCYQLNFDTKTPRLGYELCIVTVYWSPEDGRFLKYLDTKTKTWNHLTDIPKEHSRAGYKVCCVEGNIYLVGNRRVTKYNPRTNTWRNMPSLQQSRIGHSVCTLANKIFVLGGDCGSATTCEMLDLSEDEPQWRYIANMNSRHHACGAVVVERKIYALGGDRDTVDVYDADQDQWKTPVTNILTYRICQGVAALDNKIYVSGGHGGDYQPMSSVDCYDPETDTWSQMANMNIARYGHSLVSLYGKMYAIGGADADSVEVYDPDNNTWTLLQHKLDGRVDGTGAGIKRFFLNN